MFRIRITTLTDFILHQSVATHASNATIELETEHLAYAEPTHRDVFARLRSIKQPLD